MVFKGGLVLRHPRGHLRFSTDVDATPHVPPAHKLSADIERSGNVLAAVSITLGILMVANTLSMSVLQRTQEFGVRAALGWTRSQVAMLVLGESGAVGLVAGLIGTAFGLCLAALFASQDGSVLIVPFGVVAIAPLVGLMAGAVGGAVPAIRAASIDPVVSLRG